MRRTRHGLAAGLAIVLLGLAGAAHATTIVRFAPADRTVGFGSTFTVDVVADFSEPVLGWGLDLAWDPTVVALAAAPLVDPLWDPAFAPDGDGLVGIAPVDGVVGTDVRLATLTFDTVGIGTGAFALDVTDGDLTEGVPLLAGGFDSVAFVDGSVTVVASLPEPAVGLLLGLGVASCARPWARARELHASRSEQA